MSIIRRDMTMEVVKYPVSSYLEVTNLISVFYSDFSYGYQSPGEFHNFWEIIYVDKGTVQVVTDNDRFELKARQIYIHPPNEYHQHISVNPKGASVMILAFETSGQKPDVAHCNKLCLPESLRKELSKLVEYSAHVFESIQETGNLWQLRSHLRVDKRREQLFKNTLEVFLLRLSLWDGKSDEGGEQVFAQPMPAPVAQTLFEAVCHHLEEQVFTSIRLDELCKRFGCSKTALSDCFHKNAGMGPIHYFNKIKIEKAKELLDNTQTSITKVSYILGFSSPQYFARVFKKHLGLNPMQYVQSINQKKMAVFIPK